MVKVKNKRTNRPMTKKSKTQPIVKSSRRILDRKAFEYARLLADPCSAPICHPVYAGGDSGFLFRAEAVATHGGGATETCGFLHWTPGYVNNNHTDIVLAAGALPGTNLTAGTFGGGPGKTFLANNASAVRCVAACLKVTFPGAESARAGRIHYGHTMAGLIDTGDSTSVDAIAPVTQHFSRVPPETIELVWRPGAADTEFNDPRVNANAVIRDRKSSLTFAWAGIPGGTGMTFHYTAVYEWVPSAAQGLSTNMTGKNTSTNTLDDVIDFLQDAQAFTWVRGASHMVGAAVGAGMVTGIARTFGLMPAVGYGYGRQRLLN